MFTSNAPNAAVLQSSFRSAEISNCQKSTFSKNPTVFDLLRETNCLLVDFRFGVEGELLNPLGHRTTGANQNFWG